MTGYSIQYLVETDGNGISKLPFQVVWLIAAQMLNGINQTITRPVTLPGRAEVADGPGCVLRPIDHRRACGVMPRASAPR